MKYYVRKDAASEIEGPFDLEAIRGWVAGGRFNNDFQAIEENGRTPDQIRVSRRWIRLEDVFSEPLPRLAEQAPRIFLANVRQNSCYKTLRLFIDLATIAAAIACFVILYLEFPKEVANEQVGQTVLGVAILALIVVGLVALRQGALVFADIADILIEQNRRK